MSWKCTNKDDFYLPERPPTCHVSQERDTSSQSIVADLWAGQKVSNRQPDASSWQLWPQHVRMCRHLPKKEKDLASIWSNGNLVNAEGIKKKRKKTASHTHTDGDNTGSEDVSVKLKIKWVFYLIDNILPSTTPT